MLLPTLVDDKKLDLLIADRGKATKGRNRWRKMIFETIDQIRAYERQMHFWFDQRHKSDSPWTWDYCRKRFNTYRKLRKRYLHSLAYETSNLMRWYK